MSTIQHVFKRGSVYWWRRRLRIGTDSRVFLRIEISLNTKNLDKAKRAAAELTLVSEKLAPLLRDNMISEADGIKILKKVALGHSAKLDAVAANEIAYGADVESSRRADIATGWAYRLFAAHGERANVGEHEMRAMQKAGLNDETIVQVQQTIATLRANGAFFPAPAKILSLMQEFGIASTNGNFQQAQQLYLRGMAAALLDTERRWTGVRFDDDALLQSAYLDRVSGPPAISPPPVNTQATVPEPLPRAALPAASVLMEPSLLTGASVAGAAILRESDTQPTDLDVDEGEDDDEDEDVSLVDLVVQFGGDRNTEGEWSDKTLKQQIALARLFVRFVGHDNPRKMRQTHIAQFRSALLKFPKNYGKSPMDLKLTVPEILARAADMPADKVGLSTGTMNRHMTQMGNIVQICKSAGYPFADYDGVDGLRSKKRGSARGERPPFQTSELQTLFDLPVWQGCKSEDERLEPGESVIHDASYWGPLLAAYFGMRREEFCGLLLSEIEAFEGMDCIRVEDNFIRKLKTPESKRRVPIHPELIRLGFLQYVGALRKAGHILLFPELRAAAESTPMGDVFDDMWQAMRADALPNAKQEGKVLHSFRHWCNNEMKQAGVSLEIRRDVIGHSNGDDVNSGRYSEIASLRLMSGALATLPVPTVHLNVHPIRLSDIVINHVPRPSRKRKDR